MASQNSQETRGVPIRGYRRVFKVERRLFRFDRWRIPYPHGVPLRGIGYFVAFEFCVLLARSVPILGALLSVLHPSIVYLGLPLVGSVLLMQVRIDGRPPHHVFASLIRFSLGPRCLAGLEPCPDDGESVVVLDGVTVAYDSRESFAVRGRIKGPARLVVRYPSTCWFEGAPPWVRGREARRARARRYRMRRRSGGRPMLRGKVIQVPRGREVVVE